MAKNIEKDRVVKAGDKALFTQKNRVVEDKLRNKWTGLPMTEEQRKAYKKVWKEIEESITYVTCGRNNDRGSDKKTVLRQAQSRNKRIHEKILSGE